MSPPPPGGTLSSPAQPAEWGCRTGLGAALTAARGLSGVNWVQRAPFICPIGRQHRPVPRGLQAGPLSRVLRAGAPRRAVRRALSSPGGGGGRELGLSLGRWVRLRPAQRRVPSRPLPRGCHEQRGADERSCGPTEPRGSDGGSCAGGKTGRTEPRAQVPLDTLQTRWPQAGAGPPSGPGPRVTASAGDGASFPVPGPGLRGGGGGGGQRAGLSRAVATPPPPF